LRHLSYRIASTSTIIKSPTASNLQKKREEALVTSLRRLQGEKSTL
jgi:hypothetical protein